MTIAHLVNFHINLPMIKMRLLNEYKKGYCDILIALFLLILMITYLDGCLAELLPGRLTIDVSGLGYEVLVPLSTSDTMPSYRRKGPHTNSHARPGTGTDTLWFCY